VNKYFKNAISFLVMLSLLGMHFASYAQPSPDLCSQHTVVFGFFNGVQTTIADANRSMEEMKAIYGDSAVNDPMIYDLFYNDTNGMADFVEVFEQRLQEHGQLLAGRFELFFGTLRDSNDEHSWWQRIIAAVPQTASILDGLRNTAQALAARVISAVAGWALNWDNAPTQENYAEHRQRISGHALEGRKMLFVAHSQGNLFVNPAHSYAQDKIGAEAVRTVHIAPASPLLNGRYTLADLDLAINALRVSGQVPASNSAIPFPPRPPGRNGGTDIMGHGLLEIYLNPNLQDVWGRVNSDILTAMLELKDAAPPPARGSYGMFTATLEWDGSGDVDLHTWEPDGTHVYYAAPNGNAGHLDVDNTRGFGPEHYFASCARERLQTGTYRIALANYARAQGRRASVQIASWADGVLSTRQVVLGEETGDTPSVTLFRVGVMQNPNTGRHQVYLID